MFDTIWHSISESIEQSREFVCATVTETHGHTPAGDNFKMLVFSDGSIKGTIGGGKLEMEVIETAVSIFQTRKNKLVLYDLDSGSPEDKAKQTGMVCGGKLSVYFEYAGTLNQLIVIGAGHVGSAVLELGRSLPFSCLCIDHRKKLTTHISGKYSIPTANTFDKNLFRDNCMIVIASPSHDYDYQYVKQIIENEVKFIYLGILASKKKWIWMKEKLKEELTLPFDGSDIYSPAGLSTGGSTPADIAVSIISEINAIRYGQQKISHLRK